MEEPNTDVVQLFRRFLKEEVERLSKTLEKGEGLHTIMTEATQRAFFRLHGEKALIPRDVLEKLLKEERSKSKDKE